MKRQRGTSTPTWSGHASDPIIHVNVRGKILKKRKQVSARFAATVHR
jgi:hypothetical protein